MVEIVTILTLFGYIYIKKGKFGQLYKDLNQTQENLLENKK